MTSLRTRCVQATAGRPHGRNFRAKNRVSLLVPTLFLEYLRRFNDTNRVAVEDVPRRLASTRFVFKILAGDRPVKNRHNSVFAIYFSTRRCL